jgi:glycosyltransferase involved in cell wall biosynthesis
LIIENLVSTIIPVYNRPALLGEAVESVLNQTYRPLEIIIVDDGSTDDTGAVAEELKEKNPCISAVIHMINGGPGAAREAGRRVIKGEFIQYLDSDDILLPRKFELQVAGLRAHPECGVAYGKTRFYVPGIYDSVGAWKRTGELIPTMFPAFLQSRWWGTSTPLYRRSIVDEAGAWTTLQNEEDWEYDCRIASQGVRLYYCDAFVSEQRGHSGEQISRYGWSDPNKLKDRAEAHALILSHALKAGISIESPEMIHFARELFLLSRQCGEAGLSRESEKLFFLARRSSEKRRAKGWDFRFYRIIAAALGWKAAGNMARLIEQAKGYAKSFSGKRSHA